MGVRLPRGDFRPLGLSLIRCARPMDGRTMACTLRSGAGGLWEMGVPSLREKYFSTYTPRRKKAQILSVVHAPPEKGFCFLPAACAAKECSS